MHHTNIWFSKLIHRKKRREDFLTCDSVFGSALPSLRRQAARPEGKLAAQHAEGVKVASMFVILGGVCGHQPSGVLVEGYNATDGAATRPAKMSQAGLDR